MSNFNRFPSKLLIILFLGFLVLPNIIMLFNSHGNESKPWPDINIKTPIKTLGQYKNHYINNYGLKQLIIDNYISFKKNILKENPLPNKVVYGKDDWLFLGNHFENTLYNSFGNDHFKNNQEERLVDYFGKIKHYLDGKGIKFYIVIPPDKNRIYQEYLPYRLSQNTTKLQHLKSALKQKYNINIIDLYKTLHDSKKEEQLYMKTDTHWNDYGAFLGFKEVTNKINPFFKQSSSLNRSDYNIHKVAINNGDIPKSINLEIQDTTIKFSKKIKSQVQLKKDQSPVLHYINPLLDKKLLMYRDSFSSAWIKYFNEIFGESLYIRKYDFNPSLIESYKPDIVIFEIIERNIGTLVKNKSSQK